MSSTTPSRNPNLDPYAFEPVRPPSPGEDPLLGPRPTSWWTGRPPSDCPGLCADGALRSLSMPNLATCTRREVLDYFDNAWTLTELLFSALQGEVAFRRAPYHRLRHPLIFYYAHPAAFYVNKLRVAGLHHEPLDEELETLFQTGVDELSWDDLSQTETDWPEVSRVTEYRRSVYRLVRRVIESDPTLAEQHPPITMQSPAWALFMGLEHERIHLELSAVLVRELLLSLIRRPDAWPPNAPTSAPQSAGEPAANLFVAVGGESLVLGKPRDWPAYGWDNEYGERHAHVRPFRATRFLISNVELRDFVLAGGYQERRFWTDEGWRWRSFRNARWPTFWTAAGPAGLQEYALRTLFETIEMPWSWPALVNIHEAQAYCAWRRERDASVLPYRLITEAEHHCLRDAVVDAPSGQRADAQRNLGLAHGSEGPVDAYPPTPRGFSDVFGNAWEWCEDHFHPLPGFRVHPYYDDFSSPCFDGKHQMVLGGSFISTGDAASVWARFHFRPHFFQQSGFRVACSDDGDADCDAVRLDASGGSADVYERPELLDQYMMLHYGSDEDAMPYAFGPKGAAGFPRRCAELVAELCARFGVETGRALDVGCAVGGAAFELARSFRAVVGVDLSASFIAAANTLKTRGRLPFTRHDEGELGVHRFAAVDASIDLDRVSFRQADACALPAELHGFDAVLLANLLCRLPSPRACLARMGGSRGMVRPGGLLVLMSPYTWIEAFTPKDVWLGGLVRDGAEVRSMDGLHAVLDPEFERVDEREMPLVIREHARKYQYIVAHATTWRRRASRA